jgi:hypothetical protein
VAEEAARTANATEPRETGRTAEAADTADTGAVGELAAGQRDNSGPSGATESSGTTSAGPATGTAVTAVSDEQTGTAAGTTGTPDASIAAVSAGTTVLFNCRGRGPVRSGTTGTADAAGPSFATPAEEQAGMAAGTTVATDSAIAAAAAVHARHPTNSGDPVATVATSATVTAEESGVTAAPTRSTEPAGTTISAVTPQQTPGAAPTTSHARLGARPTNATVAGQPTATYPIRPFLRAIGTVANQAASATECEPGHRRDRSGPYFRRSGRAEPRRRHARWRSLRRPGI